MYTTSYLIEWDDVVVNIFWLISGAQWTNVDDQRLPASSGSLTQTDEPAWKHRRSFRASYSAKLAWLARPRRVRFFNGERGRYGVVIGRSREWLSENRACALTHVCSAHAAALHQSQWARLGPSTSLDPTCVSNDQEGLWRSELWWRRSAVSDIARKILVRWCLHGLVKDKCSKLFFTVRVFNAVAS